MCLELKSSKKTTIRERSSDSSVYDAARRLGLSHLQADILSRRKLASSAALAGLVDPRLSAIPAPLLLKNCELAVARIVRAVKEREHIGLLTDYDVDGLASHAVAKNAFVGFFGVAEELIHSFVGNRLADGYGLTSQLCDTILTVSPRISLLITADCGVSDEKRLVLLKEAGIDVVVTDHHLVPADNVPHSAFALVNPQQQGCLYPDKEISGCMVCWLVMSAVRTRLVADGLVAATTPTLISLLDYVALATIADSVSLLSSTNRAVVRYGLAEMNKLVRCCWQAMRFGDRPIVTLTEDDLAFQVSPRINGAGRMADPRLALEFLLAEKGEDAGKSFTHLTRLNQERKEHEARAMLVAHELAAAEKINRGLVLYHAEFHPGILGILASRLAEVYRVPVVVFADTSQPGILAGSCRTSGAIHIRNILALTVDMEKTTEQKSIISFGGHQGAAGMKIHLSGLDRFRSNFRAALGKEKGGDDRTVILETDGALAPKAISLAALDEISGLAPFGHHFQAPVFANEFIVESAKFVGRNKDHLQLRLRISTACFQGIWFRAEARNQRAAELTTVGRQLHCVYQLAGNYYGGARRVQLCIQDVAEAAGTI